MSLVASKLEQGENKKQPFRAPPLPPLSSSPCRSNSVNPPDIVLERGFRLKRAETPSDQPRYACFLVQRLQVDIIELLVFVRLLRPSMDFPQATIPFENSFRILGAVFETDVLGPLCEPLHPERFTRRVDYSVRWGILFEPFARVPPGFVSGNVE